MNPKPRPTLRRRMLWQIALMITGTGVIGLVAVWEVNGLHEDFGLAIQGYRQLRQIYEVGQPLAAARESLAAADSAAAQRAIQSAASKLQSVSHGDGAAWPSAWFDEANRSQCLALLHEAAGHLAKTDATEISPALSSVNAVMGKLVQSSADIRRIIQARQQAADHKRRETQIIALIFGLLTTALAVVVGVRQYRSVLRRLEQLGRQVRNFAGGRLDSRIPVTGDGEFASLAEDFNRMAVELDSFYRELEQKVRLKSKELARSERLASVGYLAAGVAHEINNPLGIIAGYGERSLRLLDEGPQPASVPRIRQAIQVICEEAFRCKQITTQLLSLARPGKEDLRPVPLDAVARSIILNLSGLPRYADRHIALDCDSAQDLTIMAKEGEMKQAVLNLLLNALDAVAPETGRVQVRLARRADDVELTVTDNGRGMTPQTLERIFEPFYSDNPGSRGTGLGLSITHAIVQDHGGRIRAESAGPGQGSRFVVVLPAIKKEV